MSDPWARYRASVEPTEESIERVRARLAASEIPDPELRLLASPRPSAEARVRARLERARPPTLVRPVLLLAAPLAAAAALFVALAQPAPARQLSADLSAETPATFALTAEVGLSYTGAGAVSGTERAPVIRWQAGTLRLDIAPDRGIALAVETPEAHVEVVGTVFEVARSTLGTRVDVMRGQVAVRCADDGERRLLSAGGSRTCLPTRAAGLLVRARTLDEAGAPSADVIDALDRGLALSPDEPLRSELEALRINALAEAGREAEARDAADRFLARAGGARRDEVTRIAARLALRAEGCTATVALLDGIPPEQRVASDEIARADCLATTDPAKARAALEAALALSPTDALSDRIRARLARP